MQLWEAVLKWLRNQSQVSVLHLDPCDKVLVQGKLQQFSNLDFVCVKLQIYWIFLNTFKTILSLERPSQSQTAEVIIKLKFWVVLLMPIYILWKFWFDRSIIVSCGGSSPDQIWIFWLSPFYSSAYWPLQAHISTGYYDKLLQISFELKLLSSTPCCMDYICCHKKRTIS